MHTPAQSSTSGGTQGRGPSSQPHMAMTPPPPPAADPAAAAHSVFVYGSLMADEVVRAILKRVPPAAPALLPN